MINADTLFYHGVEFSIEICDDPSSNTYNFRTHYDTHTLQTCDIYGVYLSDLSTWLRGLEVIVYAED